RRDSLRSGEFDLAARNTNNIGLCHYLRHQFRSALACYQEATRLAEKAGDRSIASGVQANLAMLYTDLGDVDSAAQLVESCLAGLSGEDRRKRLPALQLQLGILRTRQQRFAEAVKLFRQGIDGADQIGDMRL